MASSLSQKDLDSPLEASQLCPQCGLLLQGRPERRQRRPALAAVEQGLQQQGQVVVALGVAQLVGYELGQVPSLLLGQPARCPGQLALLLDVLEDGHEGRHVKAGGSQGDRLAELELPQQAVVGSHAHQPGLALVRGCGLAAVLDDSLGGLLDRGDLEPEALLLGLVLGGR
jgi:hypothetical protein